MLSDESPVAYITAEPGFLGSERLLILGRNILTDIGDIADVLAIDDRGVVHVIAFLAGRQSEKTPAGREGEGGLV